MQTKHIRFRINKGKFAILKFILSLITFIEPFDTSMYENYH